MQFPSLSEQALFLTGPTASGKTAIALQIASQIGAEIISMDSMALFLRLDVGTAKPTCDELARIPHHLVNTVEPWLEYSLADYLEAAHHATAEIRHRGKRVLFVGGTPLYLKSLIRGVESGPEPDPAYRSELQDYASKHGSGALHRQLGEVDPQGAQRIHPNDLRRIIRALEVHRATGGAISNTQKHFRGTLSSARVVCLDWPRDALYARIDQRVERMIQNGLVAEVQSLLQLDKPLSRTAEQALGYKEMIHHLSGKMSLEETIELIQTRSRQFAKRQLTWFRGIEECSWIAPGDENALIKMFDIFESDNKS